MSYLDMILNEAAVASTPNLRAATGVNPTYRTRGPRASENSAASRHAEKRAAAQELKAMKKAGRSHFRIESEKEDMIAIQSQKVKALKDRLANMKDSNGNIIDPSRYAAVKAELDREESALKKIITATKGKSSSSSFHYEKNKANYATKGSHNASASGEDHQSARARTAYLEGFYDALDEMGYYDEDYDDYEYEDDYDYEDAEQSYLEGYYLAMLDNGYDID